MDFLSLVSASPYIYSKIASHHPTERLYNAYANLETKKMCVWQSPTLITPNTQPERPQLAAPLRMEGSNNLDVQSLRIHRIISPAPYIVCVLINASRLECCELFYFGLDIDPALF